MRADTRVCFLFPEFFQGSYCLQAVWMLAADCSFLRPLTRALRSLMHVILGGGYMRLLFLETLDESVAEFDACDMGRRIHAMTLS